MKYPRSLSLLNLLPSLLFWMTYGFLGLTINSCESNYVNYRVVVPAPQAEKGQVLTFNMASGFTLLDNLTDLVLKVGIFKSEATGARVMDGNVQTFQFKNQAQQFKLVDLPIGQRIFVLELYNGEKIIGKGEFEWTIVPGEQAIDEPVSITIYIDQLEPEKENIPVNVSVQFSQPTYDDDVSAIFKEYCTYACHTTARLTANPSADSELDLSVFPFKSDYFEDLGEIVLFSLDSMLVGTVGSNTDPDLKILVGGGQTNMPKDTSRDPGVAFAGKVPLEKIQLVKKWYMNGMPKDKSEVAGSGSAQTISKIKLQLTPKGADGMQPIEIELSEHEGQWQAIIPELVLNLEYNIKATIYGDSDVVLHDGDAGQILAKDNQPLMIDLFVSIDDPQLSFSIEFKEGRLEP